MDSATIIIAAVSLLICSLPFVIGRNNRKKRENALLNELKTNAKSRSIQLTKHELISNFVIALDEVSNILYFLNKKASGDHFLELNLANYTNCELQQRAHQEGENGNTRSVIDQLMLKFQPADQADKIVLIEIYNRTETQALSGEFQLAQEWVKLLNERFN